MTQWPIRHFTADELDAFHSASLDVEAQKHLDECAECRAMAMLDRRIIGALAALPSHAPAPEFTARVMAKIAPPAAAGVRLLRPRSRAEWGRLAFAASVVASLATSVVWSLFNRELLLSWINSSAADTGRTFWLGVRVVATNLTAQPWYDPLREWAGSTGRLIAMGSGLAVVYGASIVALRKLLTPPSRPVPHAHG